MGHGKGRDNLAAEVALEFLVQGNARFSNNLRSVKRQPTPELVMGLAQKGQKPFCVILTDSDSRMPVEIIFDRGLGELFVVRTLGSLVDPCVIASIEYAVVSFDVQLLVILGNSLSGAIRMTIDNEDKKGATLSPLVHATVERVRPSLARARLSLQTFGPLGDRSSMRDKVFNLTSSMIAQESEQHILKTSSLVADRIEDGTLDIVTGVYGLASGIATLKIKPSLLSRMKKERIFSEVNSYEKKVSEITGTAASRVSRKHAS